MKTGVELIAEESTRQGFKERWDGAQDDDLGDEQLAVAAALYALPDHLRYDHPLSVTPIHWPWCPSWWNPDPEHRIWELVQAGALIAAEIDRLQRAK